MRFFLILILAAAVLSGCDRTEYRRTAGAAWGTMYHITYRSDRDLADSVVAEMRRVELSLSAFEPASTISRVNRGETNYVDSMFAEVFAASRLVARVSEGAFDPTVAPLVNMWGFGYRKGEDEPPAQTIVDEARAKVGILDCSLDGLTLIKKHPDTEFDFSAVAKGYGVDRVAAMLRRNGVADYMVEIGGEVAAAGLNSRGTPWRIAVEAPSDNEATNPVTTVELRDCAIATSGNYRNYRELTPDSIIGHTIDPRSGYPAISSTLSATVEAPSCMLADALATACMVLSPQQALALADSIHGVRIMLVTCAPDKSLRMLGKL